MAKKTRRLYSLDDQHIEKLKIMADHAKMNQSEYLRELIEVAYVCFLQKLQGIHVESA